MSFLVVLGRLTAFTDMFLSGLVIPIIPTILQHRAHVPPQQVQIWTSVLVAAYGGAFAVVSPLMTFLTRQGPKGYAILLAGLACAAAAFALLQFSDDLFTLILARVLQGLAAAAITGASSGLLATAASTNTASTNITWLSPAFLQSTAMTTAPLIAGFLHDHYSSDALFYCAYAVIAFNMLLALAVASVTLISRAGSTDETTGLLESETQQGGGYGTMPSEAGGHSRRSSRSISPTSVPVVSSQPSPPSTADAAAIWRRLSVALGGYLVVGLISSALQSVLPLFVQRHFDWSVLESGYMFVPLSAPSAVLGLLSGILAKHVPKSARFLTTSGFLALLPAFLYLGQLKDNTRFVQHAFLLTLSAISFATGLCGDPLSKEIASVLGDSADSPSNAIAQATVLPNLANAWGSLIGPLFAGAVSYLWGWETMNKSLAVLATATGVTSLLFLQGWIGNPYPDIQARRAGPASDEESAPLLANGRSNGGSHEHSGAYDGKEERYAGRQGSDDVSPHTRSDGDRKHRSHRRHFSVDNFSVATTAGAGSMDSSTSSVRFQAALETPMQSSMTVSSSSRRPSASDSASRASGGGGGGAERRYVMREAPHAPATDPLLAAGSLYVIDEERDTARGVESERQKRRVVVFPEGAAPPGLLQRHRHHTVAINALDGTAQMVSESSESHAVHVTEDGGAEDEDAAFEETTSRRYVVVVVEGEDPEAE
ncbi:major facilitator superfamily domain-containing protein [Chaetomium fimeti]|uniref:Major facilitator superfamily domain-containing protein n=1 Tax=Chaetomium fimeti TaxID=1854472 RepID=A0AAE0HLG8_9PEZI|nr:major facilitator superfamily domain-containing protein [Chaetomium fimeti]